MEKKTKIIATVGPNTGTKQKIEQLIKAGANGIRLNFSYGNHAEMKKIIDAVRSIEKKLKMPISIIADIQGRKIRIGKLSQNILLKKGQKVLLVSENTYENSIKKEQQNKKALIKKFSEKQSWFQKTPIILPIDLPHIENILETGYEILIDNGEIELKVLKTHANGIETEVITAGTVRSNKGVNIPALQIKTAPLGKKDIEDTYFALKNGVHYIALSFTETADDIIQLKKLIEQQENQHPTKLAQLYEDTKTTEAYRTHVIGKIERRAALKHFDEILDVADGIMVARGDLGIEVPLENVPLIQKYITQKCNAYGKPCIIATQMLESMIENPTPTRAEVSDVANAVLDGADALMLSGETAVGKYPVKSVQIMSTVAKKMEPTLMKNDADPIIAKHRKSMNITEAISQATYKIAEQINAKAIMCITNSGFTARTIGRFKPKIPIYAITPSKKTEHELMLSWGIKPYLLPFSSSLENVIHESIEHLKKLKLIQKNDKVIIAAGYSKLYKIKRSNVIKVHIVH
ncbi:pyruvate kinase [Candidatus Peregrinibacteria bacterium]|nr:pyruvate kinase [Candidatus Peregrinibacteria bacterium]